MLYIWGTRSDMGFKRPEVSVGRAHDTITLKDILGCGEPRPPTECMQVGQLLPQAAAECVKQVAERFDTLQLHGLG